MLKCICPHFYELIIFFFSLREIKGKSALYYNHVLRLYGCKSCRIYISLPKSVVVGVD